MSADVADQAVPAPRREILGTEVLAVGWEEGIALLDRLLREHRFTPVSFLNAHNANVAARNRDFAEAMADFLVLPDGVGVDVASRALYGVQFPANLNGTDFIPALIRAIARPMRVGLLGASPANIAAAADELRAIAPWHDYHLISHGFFSAEEEARILASLKQIRPDILLVALGVPRQELWIARRLSGEHCTMPIGVGALLDFLSGAVPRAPQWVRRIRAEWLFRLWLEPGRLWRRYIVGNPVFLYRVLRQRLRQGRPNG